MPLIYEPKKPHRCDPPINGMVPHVCVIPEYRRGSLWECDECQAWWIVCYDTTYAHMGVRDQWRVLTPRQKRKVLRHGTKYTDRISERVIW